jgi:hypothetical protein
MMKINRRRGFETFIADNGEFGCFFSHDTSSGLDSRFDVIQAIVVPN